MSKLLAMTGTCDCCGKEFKKNVRYGPEYGIVRLDNSGELFSEFDLCDVCFTKFMGKVSEVKKVMCMKEK